MHEYYLFNHANIASLQGQTLTFNATDDDNAILLGEDYATKLGWKSYSIVKYNGEEEVTIYNSNHDYARITAYLDEQGVNWTADIKDDKTVILYYGANYDHSFSFDKFGKLMGV